jgi:hypothetical protein
MIGVEDHDAVRLRPVEMDPSSGGKHVVDEDQRPSSDEILIVGGGIGSGRRYRESQH